MDRKLQHLNEIVSDMNKMSSNLLSIWNDDKAVHFKDKCVDMIDRYSRNYQGEARMHLTEIKEIQRSIEISEGIIRRALDLI